MEGKRRKSDFNTFFCGSGRKERNPAEFVVYSSPADCGITPIANSSIVAWALSKVLKIEPVSFPGNRSHAMVTFHG